MVHSLMYRLLNGGVSPNEIVDREGGGGVVTNSFEALERGNHCLFQGRIPFFA